VAPGWVGRHQCEFHRSVHRRVLTHALAHRDISANPLHSTEMCASHTLLTDRPSTLTSSSKERTSPPSWSLNTIPHGKEAGHLGK
jgi:hypothetical protein